jgi:hypothetical protein
MSDIRSSGQDDFPSKQLLKPDGSRPEDGVTFCDRGSVALGSLPGNVLVCSVGKASVDLAVATRPDEGNMVKRFLKICAVSGTVLGRSTSLVDVQHGKDDGRPQEFCDSRRLAKDIAESFFSQKRSLWSCYP